MRMLAWIGLILAAAGGISTLGQAAAGHEAARARVAMALEDYDQAERAARRALSMDPWQARAFYSQCVLLKRRGAWKELLGETQAARAWDPEMTEVLKFAAEAAWQINDNAHAAESAWMGFWLEPLPAHSASQLWRIAMQAGAEANGPAAATTLAAGWRAVSLLPRDKELPLQATDATLRAAADIFARAGLPLTSQLLRAETIPGFAPGQ